MLSRRKFLKLASAAAVVPLIDGCAVTKNSNGNEPFKILLLGDLHYDKMEHHDMDYVKLKYPNDIGQIENYSRITKDNYPVLLNAAKAKASAAGVDFWLQLGDFVEGLCGSEKLTSIQTNEFIQSIKQLDVKKPFYVVKGNHDITGEGARNAYDKIVLPWQSEELRFNVSSANVTFIHKGIRFIFFDCYSPDVSLAWLESVLSNNHAPVIFAAHQPAIPYNARSNWHVFGRQNEIEKREKFLRLLASHNATLLTAHLHKFSVVKREVPQTGTITQLAIGSVVDSLTAQPRDIIAGVENYNDTLTNLEPNFSPTSLDERKNNLVKERPFIRSFEYADFCGYGVLNVSGNGKCSVDVYKNADLNLYKSVVVG